MLLALVLPAMPRASRACVGADCMNIFATEDGRGPLTIEWDFATRKVQAFQIFCGSGMCLYSAIDPGFRPGEDFRDGYRRVADGTRINFEMVAKDAAVNFRLNGSPIEPGGSGLIGTSPDYHNHPSWQLTVPEGQEGDYPISFKLTTNSAVHSDSQTYTILLTNLPTPTPAEPTASPTPTATSVQPVCPGDCDGDGRTAIDELVRGVGAALGSAEACAALDLDDSGTISISELIAAVNSALNGCAAAPTPTATQAASLDVIQRTIFSPRCAISACHDSLVRSGDLNLEEGVSHAELVGIEPDIDSAREAGLLRVDAGRPENSFLLIKLEGPPPAQGGQMPLTGALLSAAEVEIIRRWIADGAAQ